MNYRHAYHAGNFADCMKHALFIALVRAMAAKEKPFLVLDTHAGIGRYDLTTGPAEKTGEWRGGIARILATRPPALADYIAVVEQIGLYPGSPAIAAALLRPADRLICCELHGQDAATLKAAFRHQRQASVHERDGYAALTAFLPPPERRALILIDPPYERDDEFARLTTSLATAYARFPSGVFAAWFPIKHRAPIRDYFAALKLTQIRDVTTATFWLREPVDPTRLNGCGLIIINPPFGFDSTALPMLRALADSLGEAGAGCAYERLIDE